MIVVDGKELNISNPVTDNEIFVSDWMKKFRSDKKKPDGTYGSVTIVDVYPFDKKKIALKKPRRFDIAGVRVNTGSGREGSEGSGIRESWVLCLKKPVVNRNGEKYYPKLHWGFYRSTTLSVNENLELIFFLTQIVNLQQFGFVIENKEEIAKKKLDTRKAEYEVGDWIMNKCTPEEIVKLSYRWGLDLEDKSDSELRDELFEKIKSMERSKDKKRGYQVFIDEMNSNSEIMKIATYFYKAIKDNKVSKNPTNRTFFWSDTTEVIGGFVPPERWAKDPEEYMVEYLSKNPKELELFMAGIEGDVNKLATEIGDYMMIKNAMQLRKWMKDKTGFDIGLCPLGEGQVKIKEFFENNPVTV